METWSLRRGHMTFLVNCVKMLRKMVEKFDFPILMEGGGHPLPGSALYTLRHKIFVVVVFVFVAKLYL